MKPTDLQLRTFAAYCRTGCQKAAADSLGVPDHRVKERLRDLYARLDVQGLGALAAAERLGWLQVPEDIAA